MEIKSQSITQRFLRKGSELKPGTIFKVQGWFFLAFVCILILALWFVGEFPAVLKSESKRQENAGVELRLIEAELQAMSEAINLLIYRQESGVSNEDSSTFLPYLEIIDLHRGLAGYRSYGKRNPHLWLDALVKPAGANTAVLQKMLVNKATFEQNPERYINDEVEFITLADRIKKNLVLPPDMRLDPESEDKRTVGMALSDMEKLLVRVVEGQTNILLNFSGLYDAKNERAVNLDEDEEVAPDLVWAKAKFYESQAILDRAEISRLIVLLSKANNNQVLQSIDDKAELYEVIIAIGIALFLALIVCGALLMYLLLHSVSDPLNRVQKILSGGVDSEAKNSFEMFEKLDELSKEETISSTLRAIARLLVKRNSEAQERKLAEAKAQQASSTMRDTLKHVSHEIGNPLASAAGLIRQMKMKDTTRVEDTARLQVIRRQFSQVTDLFENFLLAQRIEDDKLELRKDTLSIVDSVVQKMNAVEHLAKEHGVSLMLDLDCPNINDCDLVIADSTRLGQIWYNLLSNAVKFTKDSARREVSVAIRATPLKSMVKFQVRVKDTGIGMKPEVLRRLGQQFMQASPEIQSRFGGTGLGMNIVRKLVAAFQGTIVPKSKINEGTEFILEFIFPAAGAPLFSNKESRASKRVIVVDSVSQGNRRSSAASTLAAAGYRVDSYSSSAFAMLSIPELGVFDNILISQDSWEALATAERQLFQQIQSLVPGSVVPVYPYLSTAEEAALSKSEGLYHPLTPAQLDSYLSTHNSGKATAFYTQESAAVPNLLSLTSIDKPRDGQETNSEFAGMSVLLVDDSPAVLSFMAEDLRQLGVAVKTANSADDALSQLQRYIALNRPLSLILTDFQMDPDGETAKTGLWLSSRVRACAVEEYAKTPIVLFTGNQGFLSSAQTRTAKDLGLFGITDKGFNPEKLTELLRRVRDGVPYEIIESQAQPDTAGDKAAELAPMHSPSIKGTRFKQESLLAMAQALKEAKSSFQVAAKKGRPLDFAGEAHSLAGTSALVFSDEDYRNFFKAIEEKFKESHYETSADAIPDLQQTLLVVLDVIERLEQATREALNRV